MTVFQQALERFPQVPYDEKTGKGNLRHVLFRAAEGTGELMVVPVCAEGKLRDEQAFANFLAENMPEMKTFTIHHNPKPGNVVMAGRDRVVLGPGYITEIIGGVAFRISPQSFFQVNTRQAERLYNAGREAANLKGTETVADLYCGTGTIGSIFAAGSKQVIGVEVVESAVNDAIENAKRNGINNISFRLGKAEDVFPVLVEEGLRPHVVVLDPPRRGSDPVTLQAVLTAAPDTIVYISCNPATLARDLKMLCEKDYELRSVQPVDLFPRTSHVESVATLCRK